MSNLIPSAPAPGGEFLLYQAEDGRTRIQCRLANDTLWLTQALIAELFQKDVRTVNEHLVNIFDEGELNREATVRKFRIVRLEGRRGVAREVKHYRLEAILAVGCGALALPLDLEQTPSALRPSRPLREATAVSRFIA